MPQENEEAQQEMRGFTEEIRARGGNPSSRLLAFQRTEPDLVTREFFRSSRRRACLSHRTAAAERGHSVGFGESRRPLLSLSKSGSLRSGNPIALCDPRGKLRTDSFLLFRGNLGVPADCSITKNAGRASIDAGSGDPASNFHHEQHTSGTGIHHLPWRSVLSHGALG